MVAVRLVGFGAVVAAAALMVSRRLHARRADAELWRQATRQDG